MVSVQASTRSSTAPRASIVVYVDGPRCSPPPPIPGRLDVTQAGVLRRPPRGVRHRRQPRRRPGRGRRLRVRGRLGWSPMGNLESVTRSDATSPCRAGRSTRSPTPDLGSGPLRRTPGRRGPRRSKSPRRRRSQGMGANSRWCRAVGLPDGSPTCAVALNVGGGADQNLICRNVVIKCRGGPGRHRPQGSAPRTAQRPSSSAGGGSSSRDTTWRAGRPAGVARRFDHQLVRADRLGDHRSGADHGELADVVAAHDCRVHAPIDAPWPTTVGSPPSPRRTHGAQVVGEHRARTDEHVVSTVTPCRPTRCSASTRSPMTAPEST